MKTQKELCEFYYYQRNGVYYYVPLDPVTREKRTAISTRTRNKFTAFQKMYASLALSKSTLYEHKADIEYVQRQCKNTDNDISKLKFEFRNIVREELKNLISDNVYVKNIKNDNEVKDNEESLAEYKDFTFYEYLSLFWNYEKSPYIKLLKQRGKTDENLPQFERFSQLSLFLKQFESELSGIMLKDVTADFISNFLLDYQSTNQVQDCTMYKYANCFKQPMRFLYLNDFTKENIADKVVYFSTKNKPRDVFEQEEINKFFSSKDNFSSKALYYYFKILYLTGCRPCEGLSLKIGDFIKKEDSYILRIQRNWNVKSRRIKSTKTRNTVDFFLPADFCEELFSDRKKAKLESDFLFPGENPDEPMDYKFMIAEFHATMKKLNLERDKLVPMSFRHNYVISLLDAGFSKDEVAYLTGHTTSTGIANYANHETEKMRVNRFNAMQCIRSKLKV